MEELKLLIDMVAHLPQMALWVLVGYLIYKLAVLGSIYGTIKFCAEKLHGWAVAKKTETVTREINLRDSLHGISITSDGTLDELIRQVRRVCGKKAYKSQFIHTASVDWLREAIDAKEKLDMEQETGNTKG